MTKAAIEPRLEKRHFAPGRAVFAQGDEGDCAYLIESGSVAIYQTAAGQRIELGTVTRGELFGEMAAIDGGKRMASAIALEDTTATRIPKEMFERKLAASDKFIRGILNFFIRNIRSNHRGFLRRPRSVNDHVRMLGFIAGNVRAFAEKAGDDPAAAELRRHLEDLDRTLAAIRAAAQRCRDVRHDLIIDLDGEIGDAVSPARPETPAG
ncbi:cyclic nucleotide-binding domain-containing protein [Magnetospirillum sp. UT-4]|uniref:cyclic nucleotide-binding domain-containing protein n=1 Tax=Magnetospirillum sp. UT-4 TaxID=2681467 RepID=UPI0013808F3F|nr:cyclic nucleotide-binding domain-containing protein [Magnetospirillum sp. UT-4]CAA7614097.1 cAMP-binding protein [Magnetospirillum sp. UT-4]